MENKPLISVVIAHWNGEKIIQDCLESVFKTDYPNFEVVLVDNHSTDNSVKIIKEKFNDSRLRLYENSVNKGFTGGYNDGVSYAEGDFICILNNDVEVNTDWLTRLYEFMSENPEYVIVQPKIKSLRDKRFFEYAGGAGGYIDRYGYPFTRGRMFNDVEVDEGQYDEPEQIFWASGCCLIFRRSIIEEIGFLDDDFFAHQEEVDFCWRANLAGHKIGYCPSSVIYHLGGATLNQGSFFKIYLNHRNNMQMVLKNMTVGWIIFSFFPRMFLEIVSGFMSWKRFKGVWYSMYYNIRYLNRTLKKRKEVQKLRKVPDTAYENLIYQKSVVLQYFALGKKKFTDLKWRK